MNKMKAIVIHHAGSPDVLKIEERPVPVAKDGWVLIRVRAFGLNRSELFTWQGHSPNDAEQSAPPWSIMLLVGDPDAVCCPSEVVCTLLIKPARAGAVAVLDAPHSFEVVDKYGRRAILVPFSSNVAELTSDLSRCVGTIYSDDLEKSKSHNPPYGKVGNRQHESLRKWVRE